MPAERGSKAAFFSSGNAEEHLGDIVGVGCDYAVGTLRDRNDLCQSVLTSSGEGTHLQFCPLPQLQSQRLCLYQWQRHLVHSADPCHSCSLAGVCKCVKPYSIT